MKFVNDADLTEKIKLKTRQNAEIKEQKEEKESGHD